MKITVGYLVSYDYFLLMTSIKLIYKYVDKITIAIDSNRKTWSGNSFTIPQTFFSEIELFDNRKKIFFYYDNFYIATISPMECEIRERNMLLKQMGKGWKIQLDADEYIYDFIFIRKFLIKNWYFTIIPKLTPIQIKGKLITLYKQTEDGFYYIDNNEKYNFITNIDKYTRARFNVNVSSHDSNISVIHQSMARSEEEILNKFKNWGHSNDFNTNNYFNFWKNLNNSNYQKYIDFHPINPPSWNKLVFLKSKSIDEFILNYSKINPQKIIYFDKKILFKKLLNKINILNVFFNILRIS